MWLKIGEESRILLEDLLLKQEIRWKNAKMVFGLEPAE